MTVGEIVGMSISIALTMYSIISNIIMGVKNKGKDKKTTVLEILANVPFYVKQAESIFGKGCGLSKCEWVLTKIQLDAVKANVDVTEEQVKEQIELLLETPQKKSVENTDIIRQDILN